MFLCQTRRDRYGTVVEVIHRPDYFDVGTEVLREPTLTRMRREDARILERAAALGPSFPGGDRQET